MTKTKRLRPEKNDPLFVIFERHLYDLHEPGMERKDFIGRIIQEYLTFLRSQKMTIPKSLEPPLFEELFEQVNTMLVKRLYGCYSVQEYQKTVSESAKRESRSKYQKVVKLKTTRD